MVNAMGRSQNTKIFPIPTEISNPPPMEPFLLTGAQVTSETPRTATEITEQKIPGAKQTHKECKNFTLKGVLPIMTRRGPMKLGDCRLFMCVQKKMSLTTKPWPVHARNNGGCRRGALIATHVRFALSAKHVRLSSLYSVIFLTLTPNKIEISQTILSHVYSSCKKNV